MAGIIKEMTAQLRETQAKYLDTNAWERLAKPNYD